LKGPLNEAAEKMTEDNPNNDIITCNKLATSGEHINEELSEVNIREEQAEILTGQVSAIMTDVFLPDSFP
jgi:basic membrane lipoprotein Med (substrate-binding protein (PBP1-ABC) superfamily)